MFTRRSRFNPKAALQAANPGWTTTRWLAIGAWFFLVVSVVRLLSVIASTTGAPDATFAMMGDDAAPVPFLTYHGAGGATLAWVQAIAVTMTAAFTLAPVRRFRRVGHMVLLAWAGLWLSGFTLTMLETPDTLSIAQTVLMSFLFTGTLHRARARHRPLLSRIRSHRQSPSTPDTLHETHDTPISDTPIARLRAPLERAAPRLQHASQRIASTVKSHGEHVIRHARALLGDRTTTSRQAETHATGKPRHTNANEAPTATSTCA